MPKPWPEVAALNPYTPLPATDEKLRPPTPALLGLKDIPPTPAVTPLVAVAIPSTATGGTVVGEGTKGGALEPLCVAVTMALLKAVVFPMKLPVPATSSLAAGAVVPMPTFPAFGSVTSANLLLTPPVPPGAPMYRPVKFPSVVPVAMVGPSMFIPRNCYGAFAFRNDVAVIT